MSPELIAISERIRDHLTKQKAQSMGDYGKDGEGGCMYRGEEGKMCAVGCLIKDEFYDRLMEGSPAVDYSVMSAVAKSLGVEETPELENLASRWQAYHDGNTASTGENVYTKWLEGDDLHSPELFHQQLVRIL